MTQPAFLPFVCGFEGCNEDAVCGLMGDFAVYNVCRAHFKSLKGREVTDEEVAAHSGVSSPAPGQAQGGEG
jgi:hypothetical protein